MLSLPKVVEAGAATVKEIAASKATRETMGAATCLSSSHCSCKYLLLSSRERWVPRETIAVSCATSW